MKEIFKDFFKGVAASIGLGLGAYAFDELIKYVKKKNDDD